MAFVALAVTPVISLAQNNQQVVPQTRTVKNTRVELGEEKPNIIKIGETKAVKIGESKTHKISEVPSERFKKIGLDVDLRAMHEATFGQAGQNDWAAASAVPADTNSSAGVAAGTNAAPAVASAVAPRPAARAPPASEQVCIATGLPCGKLCPGH